MSRVIFLFEDDKEVRKNIHKSLRNRLKDVDIILVEGDGKTEKSKTYENQLEDMFNKYAPDGGFILSDKDLSDLGLQFIGLSGTTVANVADKLGFPLCLYARGEMQQGGEEFLKSQAPWEKKRIIIEFVSEKDGAEKCANIYRAFAEIEQKYSKLKKENKSTPASALSQILGKPEIEDQIALYGTGEQGLLQEIMPYLNGDNSSKTEKELTKRMPRILGNWLYTSILRFPGILVNEIAASSYLNIDVDDFKKAEVSRLFRKAKYKGPFSTLSEWWWRHELDKILFNSDCDDGLQYTQLKKIGFKVKPCLEPGTKERAGYYCMVTKQPVSEKNSKSGISWFPGGADLARIQKDKFNELSPWIGLY